MTQRVVELMAEIDILVAEHCGVFFSKVPDDQMDRVFHSLSPDALKKLEGMMNELKIHVNEIKGELYDR